MRTAIALATLGLALLAAAAAAQAACPGGAPMAGLVESVRGPQGGVAILRGGTRISPVPATQVCARDVVQVSGPGATITIRFANGRSQSFGPGSVTVQEPAGANRFGRAIEGRLQTLAPEVESRGKSTVTQGGGPTPFEFEATSLTAGSARMSAGWRDLDIRWFGGVGPFTVTVTPPGGAPITVTNVETHEARVPVAELGAGRWTVEVRDLVNRRASGAFTVVAGIASPAMAPEGPFAEWDDALTALTTGQDPELVFEAEQILGHAPAQGLDRTPFFMTLACHDPGSRDRAVCGGRH